MLKSVYGHDSANAREYVNPNTPAAQLYSYNTLVITIDEAGWLRITGLYSRTTIKHIGWFMRERGLSYYDAKQAYTDNKEFNILTGEYRDAV